MRWRFDILLENSGGVRRRFRHIGLGFDRNLTRCLPVRFGGFLLLGSGGSFGWLI